MLPSVDDISGFSRKNFESSKVIVGRIYSVNVIHISSTISVIPIRRMPTRLTLFLGTFLWHTVVAVRNLFRRV